MRLDFFKQQQYEGRAPAFTSLLHAVATWYAVRTYRSIQTIVKTPPRTLNRGRGGGKAPASGALVISQRSFFVLDYY